MHKNLFANFISILITRGLGSLWVKLLAFHVILNSISWTIISSLVMMLKLWMCRIPGSHHGCIYTLSSEPVLAVITFHLHYHPIIGVKMEILPSGCSHWNMISYFVMLVRQRPVCLKTILEIVSHSIILPQTSNWGADSFVLHDW